jgi:hypothetical protein
MPTDPRPVKLYDQMHNSRCHYVGGCAAEATTHVLVSDDMENVLACDEHAAWFGPGRKWAKVDDHPIGAVCGWEGVVWSFAEKRCYIADGEFELAAAELMEASL